MIEKISISEPIPNNDKLFELKINDLVEEVNRLSWIIKSVDTTGSKGAEYEQNKLK